MEMTKLPDELKKGFTHGGFFHADDVFATALLKILNPGIKIMRGFSVPMDYKGIVYDIGGGCFDHHQKDRRIRENGVPYAAFGLLWERFGEWLLCREDAERFDEEFVQQIDQSDNTGEPNMLSVTIADRNLTWQEDPSLAEEAFGKAVEYARGILEYRFRQIRADRCAYEIICEKARECEDGILYLEQAIPWKEALRGRDILYVIYPSLRGGYNVQAVPSDEDPGKPKIPFPESWRGADPRELQRITGIRDLTFCHMAGFLCAARTREGAYEAAKLSLIQH